MSKRLWSVSVLDVTDPSCGEGYLISLMEGKVERYTAFAKNVQIRESELHDLRYLRDRLNRIEKEKRNG